jgi:hypothetical protein
LMPYMPYLYRQKRFFNGSNKHTSKASKGAGQALQAD